ncbi:hypothetical protein B0A48_03254 [Cryoendolithus antarcticus]|uniref:Uncharacterized protein n=1 Tax=Cryoendolithus antarcticus TaxID=1507870 RepID=A0A1V8TJH6_9PEZI|nr:hypothetical protein B0A48_03254 [Cryoendolithus antarcticus]
MTTVRDAAAGPQNTPEDKVRGTADAFKAFTTAERSRMQQAQTSEHASRRMEKNVKLNDLKKFAENFKLASPIPDDLVSLLAKDRDKQIEIQQAAESNARNAKAGASEQGEESTASVSSSQGQPHVVTGTRGAAGEQHPLHAGSGSGRPRYRPTTVYADPVAPMADRSEPYTGKPIALYPFLPPQPTNTPIPMEEEVSTTRAPSYELSTTYANAAAPLPYQSVANTDEATAHAGMLPLLPPQLHDTPEPTGEGWSATWDSTSGQPQSSGRPYIQFGEMGPSGVPKYYKDEVIHRPSYVSHRRRSRDDEGVGLQMPKRAYMQFGAMLSESENLESVRSLEPASLRFYDVPDPDAMDSNTVGQASLAPTYVHEFPSKLPESQVQYTPLPRKSREILSGETAAAQLASPVATSPAGDSDTDTQDDSSSVAHAQSTTLPSSAAAHRMPNAHTSASKLENDGSVWSDDGLEPLTRLRLIDRLCARIERDMKHTITTSAHTDATRLALAHRLAELLKQFSILLDNRAMQGMQHRSTVFVRAQRSLIVEGLMGAVESKRMKVDDMSVVDKMSLWRQLESNASDLPHDIDLSQLAAEPDDEGPELDAADFPEAERFLTEGPAYTWLVRHLDCILNDTFLSTGEEEESIRATLLDSINDKSVRSRRIMQVTLRLPWNPLQFLHEQYGTPSQAKLVDAICLVGLPHIAFATTCLNYAQRLWPEFGPEVLRCLDDLCIQARDIKVATSMNVRSPRGFTLSFRHDGPNALFWDFIAYSACPVTLLEVGEVLCWLASTCRSHVEGVVGHVSPKLVKQGDWHVLTIESLAMPQKATDEDAAATGMCWTTMFYNPVLVRGYPVPGRSNDEPGLEILVDLMTVLGAAHRATIFDNVLVLKGFCTLKAKQFATCEASFDHLNVGRHFVGFAHEGYCTAGVKDAKYNAIGFAGEKYSTSGFALDGVSINVAKYVGIGTKLMAGNKDSAVLHAYNGPVPYRRKVAQAANINVVLYGADDRRAWFLDGASALLQLSRAALTHHRALDIREDFDITKFCHGTPEVLPARTAKDVLLDMTNRNLDLEGDGTYTFQSLVEGYLEVLLEILSHQIKLKCSETKQWQLRGIGTSRLEGFSFVDLLCAKPATQPRYIDLGKYGSNWLQFVNKAGAIVLMGTNFGALLQANLNGQIASNIRGDRPAKLRYLRGAARGRCLVE